MSGGSTTPIVVIASEDGTAIATVLPASTAAVATDPALVVTVSPNTAIAITAAALPLPTGAATEATLATRAAATQLPVALSGGRLDVVVGAALPAGANNIGGVDVLTVPAPLSTTGGGAEATALRVTIANDSTGLLSVDDNGASLTVDTTQLPAALVGGRLDENVGAWFGSTAPTVGSKASVDSVPVVIASDQAAVPVTVSGVATAANQTTLGNQTTKINDGSNTAAVKAASVSAIASDPAVAVAPRQAATATLTNVAASVASVALLAANAARIGATIFNDSNARLYVKFGATATTTSYTVRVAADGYYEAPFGYTGSVDGIWSSANGSARVTELI